MTTALFFGVGGWVLIKTFPVQWVFYIFFRGGCLLPGRVRPTPAHNATQVTACLDKQKSKSFHRSGAQLRPNFHGFVQNPSVVNKNITVSYWI